MIHLVLGGTRSGKSAHGERLLAGLPAPHAYVATWVADPGDEDMARRVAAHRARRPASWAVHEAGHDGLAPLLAGLPGTVLVDGLGTWLAGAPDLEADLEADVAALVGALTGRPGDTVVVSEEVGLALHAPTPVGRRFVDALGTLNQAVAAVAGRVTLVVAGRPLELGPAT